MGGRRATSLLAGLLATGALLAGCGDDDDDEEPEETTPGSPAEGLPEGRYEARISAERLAGVPGLPGEPAGRWEMLVDSLNVVLTAPDGTRVNETTANVTSSEVEFTPNRTEQSFSCPKGPVRGVYRWVSEGGALRFTAPNDPCRPRVAVLTAETWTP